MLRYIWVSRQIPNFPWKIFHNFPCGHRSTNCKKIMCRYHRRMVIRKYLNSSNTMSVRIAAGVFLALCGVILTSALMVLLVWALSQIGLGAGMSMLVLILVTFPFCYFLAARLPDVSFNEDKASKFTLLFIMLFALAVSFISFDSVPPKSPPRHASFAH